MKLSDPTEKIDAAVAILQRQHQGERQTLLLKRSPQSTYPNHWCFPGGHLHPGESLTQALQREVQEETGIRVDDTTCWSRHPNFRVKQTRVAAIKVPAFDQPILDVTLSNEHTEFQWVSFTDALSLPMGPLTRSLLTLSAGGRGSYWPLQGLDPLLPDAPGQFGAGRKHDIHTGVDLYAPEGTPVVAMWPGRVELIEGFTGPNASDPSPWWLDTKAVMVRYSDASFLVYGEITPCVEVGQDVEFGQLLGHVAKVLRHDKGRPTSMLHLEWLDGLAQSGIAWWRHGEKQPAQVLDPTPWLREAAGPNYNVFGHSTNG